MTTGNKQKILILGGTAEAVKLAAKLVRGGDDVVTSLAGRTQTPKTIIGKLRVGGFGGADGLETWLRENKINRIIDATHPFAKQISANAKQAAARLKLPIETVSRPPWKQVDGDQWTSVESETEARNYIAPNSRIFLALGRQHISEFSICPDVFFLLRMVDMPEENLVFPQHKLIIGKPNTDWRDEVQLLKKHKITHIVSRNSGGETSYAKIKAARKLGLPVIMIKRSLSHGQTS